MENQYSRIELYLDGLLSDAERQAFEADLHKNPELQQAVSAAREFRTNLAYAYAKKDVEDALIYRDQAERKKPAYVRFAMLLALFAIGLTAVWFLWKQPAPVPVNPPAPHIQPEKTAPETIPFPEKQEVTPTPSPQKPTVPIADNPRPQRQDPGKSILRGGETESNSVNRADAEQLETALAGYAVLPAPEAAYSTVSQLIEMKSWASAKKRLNALRVKPENERYSSYLSALCDLHLGKPRDAEKKLYPLLKAETTLKTESQYLLGWSYFLQDKKEEAAAVFSKFKNTGRPIPD